MHWTKCDDAPESDQAAGQRQEDDGPRQEAVGLGTNSQLMPAESAAETSTPDGIKPFSETVMSNAAEVRCLLGITFSELHHKAARP